MKIKRHGVENTTQIFIDKFFVPQNAIEEFTQRMQINRDFIKKLPGFIEDEAFVRTDEDGNLICITVAKWQNADALESAKAAVQKEYQRTNFNPSEMMQRLNVTMERGSYFPLDH